MKSLSYVIVTAFLILLTWMLVSATGIAGDKERPAAPRGGIYLELTEGFYKALKEDAKGTRHYSNQMSEEHLRQIAVSTRFMVETNLQILRQQEKMIQLLEEIRAKGK
jgi:nicotinamide mononucleotide (NMN) deamidase PncC